MALFSFIKPFELKICLSFPLSIFSLSLLYDSFSASIQLTCHCGKLFVKNILTLFGLDGSKLATDLPFAFFFMKLNSVCLIWLMRERT